MAAQTTEKIDIAKLDSIIDSFEKKQSNLIAILQKIQQEYRYLPEEALIRIGVKMNISPATVYGVATFYSQFSLNPKGKYEIKVCDGTACHVRGSMPVLKAIKAKLNLKGDQVTTDDANFTLVIVRCLGACGLAPIVVINDKVYPKLTPDAINIILDTFIKENIK
ncbi:MAG: NAD(P)H-dependent oxidoreductase subunit E [bacterium]